MHTLILRIVYRHLHYYSDEGFFKSQDLDERLAAMPWTAGLHLCTTIIICKKYTYSYSHIIAKVKTSMFPL